ncbi:MAG: replicative DNA helicase [Actinobacteria bacterium]|nr:replicative DNA helicase [Actinomycetota bacterium]
MVSKKELKPLDTSRMDRIPPHNIEAEQSLLGAMMLSKEAVASAIEVVDADDFYRNSHEQVFRAILNLNAVSEPVDPITVSEELKRMGELERLGGKPFIYDFVSSVPITANVKHYANIVSNYSTLRKLIDAATRIAALGYEAPKDSRAAIDKAEQLIFDISRSRSSSAPAALKSVLVETMEYIEKLYENKGGFAGLTTGYIDFDRKTSGLQPSDLIIVAARPSMGKTSFALGMARNIGINEKKPVAVFSLEMSDIQLAQRLMCSEARIDASSLKTGNLADDEWPRISSAIERLSKSPIYVDDSSSLNVMELRAKARRLKSQYDIALLIIDYLQLMQSGFDSENRQQEISDITRSLKMLAKELNIPIVALSQLSRGVEMRQNKKPLLADLRESGAIEQDADLVIFIYREKVYHRGDDEGYPEEDVNGYARPSVPKKKKYLEMSVESEGDAVGDLAEIIIGKHRNGPTGVVKMLFLERYAKFVDLARVD